MTKKAFDKIVAGLDDILAGRYYRVQGTTGSDRRKASEDARIGQSMAWRATRQQSSARWRR